MGMIKKNISVFIGIFIGVMLFSQHSGGQTSNKIVFQSGFEEGNKSIWDDWDGNPDSENKIISDPGPLNTTGNHVIRLFAPSGERGGSDLVKVLPSQYDSLYVRWYIKYENGFNFNAPNHGGGLFAGSRDYLGQSDYRPNGNDFALSSIEYNVSLHSPQIYAYYRGMYQDCSNPQGACWGDHFPCTSDDGKTYCTKVEDRDPPLPPTLVANKWYKVEMKFKMGTPSVDGSIQNGEIALWIDGQNYGDWNNLWIRTTSTLKITILWLQLFHHDGTHSSTGILMDDVVVSTEPIDIISSLNQKNTGKLFDVYPNPANNTVKICFPQTGEYLVKLYDMQGRLLFTKTLNDSQENISLEKLDHGIYNLIAVDNQSNTILGSKKLVCR